MTPPTQSFAEVCEEAARELQERDATWLTAIPKMMRAAQLLTRAAAMARENEALRHDIERHIGIASEYAQDAERFAYFAWPDPICDAIGDIDLHEQACIHASTFGREEPNKNDYVASLRDAIDAAIAAQDATR